jgi:hypothetical protein
MPRALTALVALLVVCCLPGRTRGETPARYVIQISVDGLAADWVQALVALGEAPNFRRFQREGAWTNNARTDFDFTITLPNHTCMITGLPVTDRVIGQHPYAGHLWLINDDNQPRNLHENHHAYLPSTFDVAHDHGLRTALFATKSKFKIYNDSYGGGGGAPDKIGANNGRGKIDVYVNPDRKSAKAVRSFVEMMRELPANYAFLHLHDADSAGHSKGWGGMEYDDALRAVDGYLGTIFDLVASDSRLKDRTAIILSADHGGQGRGHGDKGNPRDYTIPFYVWGAGVAPGRDLYELNPASRSNPGQGRPDYTDAKQPIRNGDGGNLALSLLGLPAIPGSLINVRQDLVVGTPPAQPAPAAEQSPPAQGPAADAAVAE